jgi:hypothetical protein
MVPAHRLRLTSVVGLRPVAPWLLIFAGVTMDGARRAEAVCRDASRRDLSIVLFDGVGHEFETGQEGISSDTRSIVVDYSEEERATPAARLSTMGRSGRGATPTLRRMVGRFGGLGRGRSGWLLVKPTVLDLALGEPPTQIVYCDESSFVSAWHSARIWPDVTVASSIDTP